MQTPFFEIYRAGVKSAADMTSATLESARRLQQQQLDALQSAIEDQAKSVRELADVQTVEALMALQTRLAGSQLERTVDLWSRMWRAAGDSQLAMIGQAQSQLGQVREGLREVTEAAQQEQRAA